MRVRNPDPAVNSLSSNIRIRRIFQYSDPPEFGITGFRNQDKASEGQRGEERTRVLTAAVNRPRSTDECPRERRGGVCPGVCISRRLTNIST